MAHEPLQKILNVIKADVLKLKQDNEYLMSKVKDLDLVLQIKRKSKEKS